MNAEADCKKKLDDMFTLLEAYKERLASVFEMLHGVRKVEMNAENPEEPGNGDLIPVAEWLGMVKTGAFIDYDGYGRFAVKLPDRWLATHVLVYPSDITKLGLSAPAWATHVLWYNR